MKVYKTNEIKNISLVGGKGAGKTTLTESILLEAGVINRRGTVDGGNTVSDNTPVEKEYGYSVSSTVFYAEKNGKKLNFFDCPGSDDFVGNAVTALSVTDAAALVVDGRNGVEVGTQNTFRTVERLNKPLMFVINRLEDEKTDFDNVYNQLRETFGNKVVALQFPVNAGPGFNSVVDVLSMKQYTWGKDGGKAPHAQQVGKKDEVAVEAERGRRSPGRDEHQGKAGRGQPYRGSSGKDPGRGPADDFAFAQQFCQVEIKLQDGFAVPSGEFRLDAVDDARQQRCEQQCHKDIAGKDPCFVH